MKSDLHAWLSSLSRSILRLQSCCFMSVFVLATYCISPLITGPECCRVWACVVQFHAKTHRWRHKVQSLFNGLDLQLARRRGTHSGFPRNVFLVSKLACSDTNIYVCAVTAYQIKRFSCQKVFTEQTHTNKNKTNNKTPSKFMCLVPSTSPGRCWSCDKMAEGWTGKFSRSGGRLDVRLISDHRYAFPSIFF